MNMDEYRITDEEQKRANEQNDPDVVRFVRLSDGRYLRQDNDIFSPDALFSENIMFTVTAGSGWNDEIDYVDFHLKKREPQDGEKRGVPDDIFNKLIQLYKAISSNGKPLKIGNFEIRSRYSKVRVSGFSQEYVDFPVLDPSVANDTVISVSFGVKGFAGDYVTEIYVDRDIIISVPMRSLDHIDTFLDAVIKVVMQ